MQQYFKLMIIFSCLLIAITMSPTKIDVNQIKSKSNESPIVKKSTAKNSNKNFYLIENDLELLPVENIIIKKKASSVTVSSKILTAMAK
jgi:hypothetical protein